MQMPASGDGTHETILKSSIRSHQEDGCSQPITEALRNAPIFFSKPMEAGHARFALCKQADAGLTDENNNTILHYAYIDKKS
jgi:hypothetical protein